ncbi:sugar ABC transporter permease [Spirochaetia bacterium]|nr:sugar ABC transporter permease [Spirochaetia bacterium]
MKKTSLNFFMMKHSGKIIVYLILLLGVYVMLDPFLRMIFTSFKTYKESMRIPPVLLPDEFILDNFKRIFSMHIGRYYLNTILVTIGITAGQLVFSVTAAYAFARIPFPGRNVLFMILLAMLMVPSQLTLIPKYGMTIQMGLYNTLWGIIVPNAFSITVMFFMRQAFMSLPRELDDAARIDGYSHFGIFWHIALPLSTSVLAAMGVLVALFAWNNLLWPIVVTGNDRMRVLSVFIAAMHGEHNVKIPELMAAGTLSVMPMLLVFIFGQKYFVTALTITGIKE